MFQGMGGSSSSRHSSRQEEYRPVKLKVMGLHAGSYNSGIMQVQLQEIFMKHGTVTDIEIPVNGGGRVKGFAYVDMSNEREAEVAIRAVSGQPYDDDVLKVSRYYGEIGTYEYYNGKKNRGRRRRGGGRGGGGRGGGRGGRRY